MILQNLPKVFYIYCARCPAVAEVLAPFQKCFTLRDLSLPKYSITIEEVRRAVSSVPRAIRPIVKIPVSTVSQGRHFSFPLCPACTKHLPTRGLLEFVPEWWATGTRIFANGPLHFIRKLVVSRARKCQMNLLTQVSSDRI